MTNLLKYILLLTLINPHTVLFGKAIHVSPAGSVTSIKNALELVEPNDTIYIGGGIYKEGNMKIEKPVTIIGIDKPVLDGETKHEIFTVYANDVVIKGLVFQNIAVDYIKDKAAIRLVSNKHCLIEGNTLLNTFFGIYLEEADSAVIKGNIIQGKAIRETTSGNAIHLWQSNANQILENKVSRHRDGIYLEFVNYTRVMGNISTGNLRYGLHFMFSNNNEYLNNDFINNGAGVAVMYSKYIKMLDNKFQENQGPAAYGILLKDITDSHIERNDFSQNTIGILAEGSNRLTMKNNNFIRNGYGLKIMGSCETLQLTGNNFIGNTFEIGTPSKSLSGHVLKENFWSKYQGYDLDQDGFGDVPHKPVRLFTFLIEKVPSSVVLIGSMFVDLLEMAEKVTPSITPDHFADQSPRMFINNWMQ